MEFKAIHKTFHGLNVQEMVALDEEGTCFKSYDEIKVHAELKRSIFVYELRKEFDAQALLNGISETGLNKTTLKRRVAKGDSEGVLRDVFRVYNDKNIVIAQLGRLNDMKTQINIGVLSNEERKLEENKIRIGILELIDSL